MDHLDEIALGELGAGMLCSRDHLFIALDGDQRTREPERGQQRLDGRVRLYLSFLTVDDETH